MHDSRNDDLASFFICLNGRTLNEKKGKLSFMLWAIARQDFLY
jgi:hypothetical protein